MDRGYGVVLEFSMSYVALTLLAYDSIHINWFLVYISGLESELNGYTTCLGSIGFFVLNLY